MDLKRINALQVAVRVLDGETGDYSKEDLYAAKVVLMNWLVELDKRS
jgi:hypothetical protein